MDYFNYKDNELYAEDIKVTDLVERYGSPLYVYSKATLVRHLKAFEDALVGKKHLVCYAVKANSSLSILNIIAKSGCGFDVVSKGELMRVIAAGGSADKAIFSGVGKREDEIEFALTHKILCLDIESESEMYKVEEVAARLGGRISSVSPLRMLSASTSTSKTARISRLAVLPAISARR